MTHDLDFEQLRETLNDVSDAVILCIGFKNEAHDLEVLGMEKGTYSDKASLIAGVIKLIADRMAEEHDLDIATTRATFMAYILKRLREDENGEVTEL